MTSSVSPDRPADGPEEESRLIERSRQGDAAAFTQLVVMHQGRVRAYVGSSVSRPDVVDDLAQEAFLSAFRSLDSYKGDAPFGVWLLGIARHKTLMYLRQELRRLARESVSVEAVLAPFRVQVVESEEQELGRREQELAALQRCLHGLPANGAEMITERYFKARSISEIARGFGKREGAVRMSLMRLRQALRDCVQQRLTKELV
jgi:RNA polymerase sigma-70 factor (ECF subfamily)